MDLLYLLVAQMPRCPDRSGDFVVTGRLTDKTNYFIPCARELVMCSWCCSLAQRVSAEQYWVTIKCGCIHNILLFIVTIF